ncbi:MAG: diguanylate cyclase [Nitrospirae bacterium]|nr:diguanylate cyclase [Nitrospirota bacterium]
MPQGLSGQRSIQPLNEALFRFLVDNSYDAMAVLREGETIAYVNRLLCELTGYKEDDLAGMPMYGMASTYELPKWKETLFNVAVGRTGALRCETSILHKCGTAIAVELRANRIQWDGRVAYLLSFRDITRYRVMEEALRSSEAKYRALFNLMPIGLSISDESGRVLDVNPVLEKTFGLKRLDNIFHVMESSEWKMMCPDGTPVHANEFACLRAIKGNKVITDIELGVSNGGEFVKWFSVTAAPLSGTSNGLVMAYVDITERKKYEERLKYFANFDILTGLPNRSLFFDRLNQMLMQARRYGHTMAILFIDLDDFKSVNDEFGHYVGDLLLQEVSSRLKYCVRESDTVARVGGDEFAVILARVNGPAEATLVTEKILASFQRPIEFDDVCCTICASIGIALFPKDGDDVDALMNRADIAMNEVKEQRVCNPSLRGTKAFMFYD